MFRPGSDVGDHVDFDQGVSRYPSGGCDGGPDRRVFAETPAENLVHRLVVLEVIQINIALQDLFHGRARVLQLFLNLIEHVLGVSLDVALEMRALARDEEQVAVRYGT